MAAFLPLVKVVRFEVFPLLAEAPDNVSVNDTIEHPVIDLVAEGFGKTSDVAVATMGARNCGLPGMGFGFRRRRRGLGAADLVIGVHRSEKASQFWSVLVSFSLMSRAPAFALEPPRRSKAMADGAERQAGGETCGDLRFTSRAACGIAAGRDTEFYKRQRRKQRQTRISRISTNPAREWRRHTKDDATKVATSFHPL